MRLTLRTLLAWMDDTLPPAEVAEIGRQVAEAPFAKELVDQIHRVTRQRRLSVPSTEGADATDPNFVSSYLDNDLGADHVTEFEKRCLTSDVNLAEVASVHQILSLIGQKAKVPDAAKHRMYSLVKGREAFKARAHRASQPEAAPRVEEPAQPWLTAVPPRRPLIERFGPTAAVLGLITALAWSAWQSLTPETTDQNAPRFVARNKPIAPKGPAVPAVVAQVAPEAPGPKAKAKGAEAAPVNELAKTNTPTTKPETGELPKSAASLDSTGEPEKKERPRLDRVPGAIGHVEKPTGVVLKFSPENRVWERLTALTSLKSQDRLLNLAPYRTTLLLGNSKVELVGETEIRALSPAPGEDARLILEEGRVVLHGASPSAPVAIQFARRNIKVTPPAGVSIGLERLNRREPGSPIALDSILRFYAPEGETGLAIDDAEEVLPGPGEITFELPGKWTGKNAKPAPSWVSEASLTPFDKQVGDHFLRFFRADRPVFTDLVEAIDDDQKDVRRLAISSLRAVGGLEMIVPLLNKEGDPTSRRAAIAVLRAYLAQDPDAARKLHDQLQTDLGDELAGPIEKLLVGFTPKAARDDSTYATLVSFLKNGDVGIRELALDNLKSLTGRDELDYNPDKPNEGKGLKAWEGLLHDHGLRPLTAPKAVK